MLTYFRHLSTGWTPSLLLVLCCLVACAGPKSPGTVTAPADVLEEVDPFIGTGGHGHTFPGATMPNGMVQLSPDTRTEGWDACGGYHYSDSTLIGFSHTHLSGTGIADMLDVLFRPFVKGAHPGEIPAATFSHDQEKAQPGYYSVRLLDEGIDAALTTSLRCGFHRYTFEQGSSPRILIDLEHGVANHQNMEMSIKVISAHEIEGYKYTRGWAKRNPVFFYAAFDQPFSAELFDDGNRVLDNETQRASSKAILTFAPSATPIIAKVGISTVDQDGARNNYQAEAAAITFAQARANAEAQWQAKIGQIGLRGGTADQRTIFRTAQYHAALSPYLQSDTDGRYRGMDQKIRQSADGPMYTVFSLWDTYRAFHPYLTLTDPVLNGRFVHALLQKADEGGVLPKWELSANYTGTMIGYHAVPVILDAYRKDNPGFEAKRAYQAMLKAAQYDTVSIDFPAPVVQQKLMPKAKWYNANLGFIPADEENESVSKALEYAYNDWCIAEMAQEMGDTATASNFRAKSQYFAQYFDAERGFMRGLNRDRSWKTPFDPRFSRHRKDEYTEGNAWQWTWYVPHDINGLESLMGGRATFLRKLDSLFSISSEVTGEHSSNDISGLIGQYAHGNEPSHHIAYLYALVGRPDRTQELVDSILNSLYFAAPNGLPGNEDCGQMSAWYLLSSMGIYPVCPGEPLYTLGRPLFDEVSIQLPDAKQLIIRATNNAPNHKYVQSIALNGRKLTEPTISHQDLMAGGTLEFAMGAKPKQ